jgi:hypothetical protein
MTGDETVALERIADTLEGLRADLQAVGEALKRIAQRTGRGEA